MILNVESFLTVVWLILFVPSFLFGIVWFVLNLIRSKFMIKFNLRRIVLWVAIITTSSVIWGLLVSLARISLHPVWLPFVNACIIYLIIGILAVWIKFTKKEWLLPFYILMPGLIFFAVWKVMIIPIGVEIDNK